MISRPAKAVGKIFYLGKDRIMNFFAFYDKSNFSKFKNFSHF